MNLIIDRKRTRWKKKKELIIIELLIFDHQISLNHSAAFLTPVFVCTTLLHLISSTYITRKLKKRSQKIIYLQCKHEQYLWFTQWSRLGFCLMWELFRLTEQLVFKENWFFLLTIIIIKTIFRWKRRKLTCKNREKFFHAHTFCDKIILFFLD